MLHEFCNVLSKGSKSIKRKLEGEFPLEIALDDQKTFNENGEHCKKYDIHLYSCCQNDLTEVDGVKQGSCINFPMLKKLFP